MNLNYFFRNSKVEEYTQEKMINPINDMISNLLKPLEKNKSHSVSTKLSFYWIEIIASLGLFLFIIMYEIFSIIFLFSLFGLFVKGIVILGQIIKLIFGTMGIKWFILNTVFQHLSVGFLCLTTFSNVFKETQNIKKFFISNIVKVILYYIISIIILEVIILSFELLIQKNVERNIYEIEPEKKKKLIEIMNKIKEFSLKIVGNLLATFNVFLDKLIIGTLYIFFFKTPNIFINTNKIISRFLSIFPVIYILLSLILRALEVAEKINLNMFVSPILLGPKITIFGFFISTLCMIKYKSTKINIFDEDNTISPEIFSEIGSKMFFIFGVTETIAGFVFPNWTKYGIGKNYLQIICTPFISTYDYKKESKVIFPCCKKKDYSKSFKIMFNIIGYLIILILGICLFILIKGIMSSFIIDIIKIIIDNFENIIALISYYLE